MGGLATFSARNFWSTPLFGPAEVRNFLDLAKTAKSQGKVNAFMVTHIEGYTKTFTAIKVPGARALSTLQLAPVSVQGKYLENSWGVWREEGQKVATIFLLHTVNYDLGQSFLPCTSK